ncbi:Site-specific recombinase XerD [Flaviramulus basaltis]|uniref:Site-specific recombinase XerD n=1 Tax=Flaviramulus basaltis TaxID=369401 RepID=A0A1K2IM41_9FLAO|nr:phage integrase SAM-like domain-containing protein [Flaviramulus basaltis]SFZ93533.1 Site-specific recombinase XerD [Flaviramulus basaltis]
MGTTLKFYIKTPKQIENHKRYPMYLRIIHNLKKSEGKISTTKISCKDIKNWDEDMQRFSSKQKHLLEHNILLNKIQNEFHNYLRTHITKMAEVRPHQITDYLLSREKNENITVIDAANQFYDKVIFPDVDKAPGTKRNYKKSINHLCNFLEYKKLDCLGVKDFKKLHVSMFIDYLKTPFPKQDKIGMNNQSVNSIVKNVKPIFSKLLFEERITTNPFIGVKVPFKKADKPRLSNEHFIKIAKLDLSKNSTLEVYRDVFLFLCYTGLSFCDAIDLKQSETEGEIIQLNRKKSNVQTKQFLPKQVLRIIEKYNGDTPEDRILPKRSLDKMNLNLKILAAKTGVDFSLSTYTARRFFRQSIFESEIRESLVIKSLMGHTSSNDIDSHYFNVSDNILKDAKKKLQKHFKKLLK